MRHYRVLLALSSFLAFVPAAHATIATAYTNVTGGSQNYNGDLAMLFTVNSPIVVSALGVYNQSGSGTITGTISVEIYNLTTNSIAVGPVAFNGAYGFCSGSTNDVCQSVPAVLLGLGNYEVEAVGFSNTDLNANIGAPFNNTGPTLNTNGGLISFTGAAYDSSITLDHPITCIGCAAAPSPQNTQFGAGTFEFADVPEPATFGLVGISLLSLAALRRNGRVK